VIGEDPPVDGLARADDALFIGPRSTDPAQGTFRQEDVGLFDSSQIGRRG
jgi:hypothetical protein